MTWLKVDDGFPTHRKVLSIPRGPRRLAAVGAWTLAGAWVAGNLNNGRIPAGVLDELAIGPRVVADLLAAGLWTENGSGYVMHDYLDYNPSADKVEKERREASERQRKARDAARQKRGEGP